MPHIFLKVPIFLVIHDHHSGIRIPLHRPSGDPFYPICKSQVETSRSQMGLVRSGTLYSFWFSGRARSQNIAPVNSSRKIPLMENPALVLSPSLPWAAGRGVGEGLCCCLSSARQGTWVLHCFCLWH